MSVLAVVVIIDIIIDVAFFFFSSSPPLAYLACQCAISAGLFFHTSSSYSRSPPSVAIAASVTTQGPGKAPARGGSKVDVRNMREQG